MADPLNEYLRRPARYENVDGLIDAGWGLIMLGFALFDWLREVTPQESLFHRRLAHIVYTVALVLAVHYGRKVLKKYVTYPRTGFIEHRKTVRKQLTSALVGLLAGVVAVGSFLVLRPGMRVGVVLLMALVNGLFYAVVTRLDRAWKWAVLLAMTAALAAIGWLPLDFKAFEQLVLVVLGAAWVLSGVVTFVWYLRNTHPPEQAAE